MRIAKMLVLTSLALAAGGGSAALADSRAADDKRGDATCRRTPCPDLKSAVADHGIFDQGQLFYIVTQYNKVDRKRLPRIAINTSGGSASAAEYYVEKRAEGAGVFDAATGEMTGTAVWSNTRRASATWTFRPRAIGSPERYGWRVEVAAKAGARIDSVPNSGYLEHRLRSGS